MLSSIVLASCITGVMSHEGFSAKVYKDRHGYAVGNGYSITENPLSLPKSTISRYKKQGISKIEAKQLVTRMCNKTASELSDNLNWFDGLSHKSQYVMLDMGYNLGIGGLLGFDKTLKYVKNNQVALASKEMLKSRWARQCKVRSIELSKVLKS
jgi:lysozyme